MKKLVLFVLLGVVGVSTLGNSTSVFADETQPEQVTLLNLEQENPINMSNPAALIIQNRDNMDVQGVYWGGKRPSKSQQTCAKGIAGGILGGIGQGITGMITGGALGAWGACT